MKTLLALLASVVLISISPAHAAQWVYNGNPVTGAAGVPSQPAVAHDGNYGIIVVWASGNAGDDIWAQRIDERGNLLWGPNGVLVCGAAGFQRHPHVASTGDGGAYVAWEDPRNDDVNYDIYMQRLHASGTPLWLADGAPVSVDSTVDYIEPRLLYMGGEAVMVSWEGNPNGGSDVDIFTQKYDGTGNPLWGGGDVTVVAFPGEQGNHQMVPDGEGGAIFAWQDLRNGTDFDIYGQRINFLGSRAWGTSTYGTAIYANYQDQWAPQMVSDGAYGAIVVFLAADINPSDVAAVRVGPGASTIWGPYGVSSIAGNKTHVRVAPDGLGGVLVTWQDDRSGDWDIYARLMNSSGSSPGWDLNGTLISTSSTDDILPAIAADGAGGAIITWASGTSLSFDNIYAQAVTNGGPGLIRWAPGGVPVCADVLGQYSPAVAVDDEGDALVAWADQRTAPVYAQRIENGFGAWGHPEPIVTGVDDVPSDNGGFIQLTWEASTGDNLLSPTIAYYNVYRATSAAGPWASIGATGAVGQMTYSYPFPTTADQTTNYFYVSGNTTGGVQWYPSRPDSGESLDDTSPSAPAGMQAQWIGNYVYLTITPADPPDPDLAYYNIYRDVVPGAQALAQAAVIGTTTGGSYTDDTVVPGNGYRYWATAVDSSGNEGAASPSDSPVVTTGATTPPITRLSLGPNTPNPFGASTSLRVGLPADGDLEVEVYDAAGRRVASRHYAGHAGWSSYAFDARDSRGRALPTGVYFYRVGTAGEWVTGKMVVRH